MQNGIYQKFQNFTCKPIVSILCMFICVDFVTSVETQFDHSTLCNFISLWKIVKNTINFCWRFFLHKINKNMERKPGVKYFLTFAGMTSLTLNSKFSSFINSWKLIKTPQSFVWVSFYIKITTICLKNRNELSTSGPL